MSKARCCPLKLEEGKCQRTPGDLSLLPPQEQVLHFPCEQKLQTQILRGKLERPVFIIQQLAPFCLSTGFSEKSILLLCRQLHLMSLQ